MTTQNPVPAPSMTTHTRCEDGGTHVWTDEEGRTHGVLYLAPGGDSSLNFHDVAQVRDLIGRLAALAGEMDAEITRQRRTGHVPGCLQPGDRPHATCPVDGDVAAPACSRCGATDTPLDDYPLAGPLCHNAVRCAERVAARDAEAVQVSR